MSKLTVVITDNGPAGVELEQKILGDAGFEVIAGQCKTAEDVIEIAADADALMVGGAPITADVIAALTRCKMIIRCGVGVDCIDVQAATAKGIAICNVPDATTNEVADHTLALALSWGRQLPAIDKRVRQGEWDITADLVMPAFQDMTFATVGFGNIARAVMERAKVFKFRLIATDPEVADEEFARLGVERMELDAVIAQADILSLHPPLTPETQHMINAQRFAQMRRGVILINAGRGELVDTGALLDALRSRHVAYAGLDVFEEEPLPAAHPLCSLHNILLTPHAAAYSDRSGPVVIRMACEEVVRALRGEALKAQVNKQ